MEQVVPARASKVQSNSGGWFPYHEAKKLSISILVISLPVLYVSLLRIPPYTLLKDTTFWFLMSNSIIIIIVATDSGMFSPASSADDLYDEFVKHGRARGAACAMIEPPPWTHFTQAGDQKENKEIDIETVDSAQSQSPPAVDKSVVVHEMAVTKPEGERMDRREDRALVLHKKSVSQVERIDDHKRVVVKKERLRRSATDKKIRDDEQEMSEYEKLSNEELNKRVEEFIRRFNREIRLQLRNDE